MSNIHNEEHLENVHHQVIEWDRKGLLDTEVNAIANCYHLHQDDDRDEILQHIAENVFYNKEELILL